MSFGGTLLELQSDANIDPAWSVKFNQWPDVDNRLAQVVSGTQTTQFGHDADGKRVLQTLPDGTQVVYVGGIEVTITGTQRITKTYYAAGAKLIAMRVMTGAVSALYFVHTDHLGSVSLTTDGSGAVVSVQKYTAWGMVRAVNGAVPTDIGYTGQRLDATGLMFYGARYYDASLSHFISADTVVPQAGNPQALNRYSYTFNNPLKFTDPTGHCPKNDDECEELKAQFESRWGKQLPDFLNKDAIGFLTWYVDTADQVFPTHFGARDEFNLAFAYNAPVGAMLGLGPQDLIGAGGGVNGTVGIIAICNRRSRSCGVGVDLGGQLQASIGFAGEGPGKGNNILVGPVVGWNADSPEEVLKGYSANIGIAGCAIFCLGQASATPLTSAPLELNGQPATLGGSPIYRPNGLYVNPRNRAPILTQFWSFGFGTAGAGAGGGASYSWMPGR